VGGAVRRDRRRPDRAPADPGHGRQHPADLLGLVDHRGIRALFRVSRSEFLVMALTAAATLLLELQTAIYAGVLASLFFYLKRTSRPRVQQSREGEADILRVGGSIFFGAAHYLQVRLQRCRGRMW
jgi:SulP family sulfate permease